MKNTIALGFALFCLTSCGVKDVSAGAENAPSGVKKGLSYNELLDAIERDHGKEARKRVEAANAKNGIVSAATAYSEFARTNKFPIGKGSIEQENKTREFHKKFADENAAAFSAMKNAGAFGKTRTVEQIFEAQWNAWNERFELGQTLNLLLADKGKNLSIIPASELSNGAAIAHLVLNLKGFLLYRELQFVKALGNLEKTDLREALEERIAAVRGKEPRPDLKLPSQVRELMREGAVFNAEQKFRLYVMKEANLERPEEVNVSDVENSLPEGSALIEYFRYGKDLGENAKIEDRYGAILISKGAEPRFIDLSLSMEVSEVASKFHSLIQRHWDFAPDNKPTEEALFSLYELLIEPVKAAIPTGCRTLFISPDGELEALPFASFRKNGKFLCEEFHLRNVLSGRSLLQKAGVQKRDGIVVFADPDFKAPRREAKAKNSVQAWLGEQTKNLGPDALAPLPGTREEAVYLQALGKQYGQSVSVKLGGDATEANLFNCGSPYILHLGTHGFYQRPPAPPADALPDMPLTTKSYQMPLYNSWLAMAGAESTREIRAKNRFPEASDDGVVSAAEVSRLNLQNTYLTTLAACDTGVGNVVDGEGIVAIKTGFFLSGTKHLLYTLWKVPDQAAPQFMKSAYRELLQGGDAVVVVADIQKRKLVDAASGKSEGSLWKAIKSYGGFVLVGNYAK